MKLESLNNPKFEPLSKNSLMHVRGGEEYPSGGATATLNGQEVKFDHDVTCYNKDGKLMTQYLDKDDKLLGTFVAK